MSSAVARLYPLSRLDSCRLSLVDSHAHLADATSFPSGGLEAVLRTADEHGVERVVCVAQSADESAASLALSRLHPRVIRACGGVHPVEWSLLPPSRRSAELVAIEAFLDAHHDEIICVGEVGLDFSPWILQQAADVCRTEEQEASSAAADGHTRAADSTAAVAAAPAAADWKSRFDAVADAAQRAAQVSLFRAQVRLAVRYGLPLNVHSRSASKHVLDVLSDEGVGIGLGPDDSVGYPRTTVLLHAFDGSAKTLREAVRRGYFFSATTALGRDAQARKAMIEVIKESKHVDIDLTLLSSLTSSADVADAAIHSPHIVSIPSSLLQVVLETDSPALHPIKQPPPSTGHDSSSSSSCCTAEDNQPCHLYIALLELYDVYRAAEADRAQAEAIKQQKRLKTKAPHARDTTNFDMSDPPPPPPPPPPAAATPLPLLTLPQLACVVLDNSLRLFPRLR